MTREEAARVAAVFTTACYYCAEALAEEMAGKDTDHPWLQLVQALNDLPYTLSETYVPDPDDVPIPDGYAIPAGFQRS